MKKFFAAVICAALLCSAAACSSQSENNTESASFEKVDASKLPSKVDLRDFDGKNYVTPVKNQRFGDCWSFSIAGAAETAYLFANDMGVAAGEKNDKIDFSEKYVAWYVYHGITKDDVVTGRVRESQAGEGFDLSKAEESNDNVAYFLGGPCVHSANLFGSGFGPVEESVSVKDEKPYAYDDQSSIEWSLPLTAEYRNAPTEAFLRNSFKLPDIAKIDKDGKYSLNEEGLNAIKSELSKGHGVSLGFCSQGGFNKKKMAAYTSGDDNPDHAVLVVGYDDDFKKENFTRKLTDGEIVEGSTPPKDGAFIIKNSWGTGEGGNDGYFYLSYYDHTIVTPLSYVFDSSKSVKHTKQNYDQYDLMMTDWYATKDYDKETKMANVFDAEADESLYQIGFTTALPKTEVNYEIYKGVEDGNPSSGSLLEKGVSRQTYAGFHKIDLKNEYELKKGDKYSVVLTMKHDKGKDGNTVYTDVLPYSTAFAAEMSVKGIINKGESYFYSDGKWSDMSDLKDDLIETAFKQGVEEIGSMKLMYEVKLDSKDTFTIDNYPIKAISAPKE